MAIKFIPNQPVIFEADTQACKNNDNRQYGALLQPGDQLHVQFKHDPCSDELLSTPGFYNGDEIFYNTDFIGGATSWTLGDWTYASDSVSINVSNTGSPLLPSLTTGLVAGMPYKLTVAVTTYVTGTLACFIGDTLAGKISSEGVHEFIITPTITGECRFQNDPDNVLIGYQPLQMTIDLISLTEMSMGINWPSGNLNQPRSYVTNPDFNGDANGWTFDALASNPWFYDTNKISKTAGNNLAIYQDVADIINREGYTIDIDVVVNAGSLNLYFGNVLIDTITATGSYSYDYPLPTIFEGNFPASAIALKPAVDAFDGSVSFIDISNTYCLVKYTESGICKTDNTQASTIEWGTLANFDVLSRLQLSIRGYESGIVTLNVNSLDWGTASGTGDFNLYALDATPLGSPAASISLILSADFIGCITSWSYKEFNTDHQIRVVSGGTPMTDWYTYASSQNPLVFHQDFISWWVDFNHVLIDDVDDFLASGCYQIQVGDACAEENITSVNNISYSYTGFPCSVAFQAWSDAPAFGFDYSEGFILSQRLRLLRISPKYPIKGDSYTYSNGQNVQTYSDVDKIWQAWFDYCDELTHDCIAVQLASDHLTIDAVPYFAPAQDYEPEWATNMKRNLAQSRVDLKKKTSKVYKRNIE